MSFPIDYPERCSMFSIASPDEIKNVLPHNDDTNTTTILLDVRTMDEIQNDGRITQFDTTPNIICCQTIATPTGCMELETNPTSVLRTDKKDCTIVIYCKSGRRAMAAKKVLQEQGYTGPLLNAGGYDDIKAVLST